MAPQAQAFFYAGPLRLSSVVFTFTGGTPRCRFVKTGSMFRLPLLGAPCLRSPHSGALRPYNLHSAPQPLVGLPPCCLSRLTRSPVRVPFRACSGLPHALNPLRRTAAFPGAPAMLPILFNTLPRALRGTSTPGRAVFSPYWLKRTIASRKRSCSFSAPVRPPGRAASAFDRASAAARLS